MGLFLVQELLLNHLAIRNIKIPIPNHAPLQLLPQLSRDSHSTESGGLPLNKTQLFHVIVRRPAYLQTGIRMINGVLKSIHPFYDGNGRTGRILNILFLILNNLIDIPILYLNSYIIENKTEYNKLLNNVNKNSDWEPWIIYMLKAVESTALKTIEKIKSITNLLYETIELVKKHEQKTYKKELIELLFEQPYSKIEYVVNRLNIERKAASRYLKKLEKLGVLRSQKVGRETIYINERLIEILKL